MNVPDRVNPKGMAGRIMHLFNKDEQKGTRTPYPGINSATKYFTEHIEQGDHPGERFPWGLICYLT